MKKGWTTTKLIAIGGLAVVAIIANFPGMILQSIFGIPLISGFSAVFVAEIMTVICLLTINRFGAASFYRLIIGILQLPLPIAGSPGFIGKIPISIGVGFLADILFHFMKGNKKLAAIIIGGIDEVYWVFALILVGRLLGMPGIEKSAKIFLNPLMILGAFLGGSIGGYLGYIIYQKIKDTSVVERIKGEQK